MKFLYGTGVYVTTARKYNFKGTSPQNPLRITDEEAERLLVLRLEGKPVLFEVKTPIEPEPQDEIVENVAENIDEKHIEPVNWNKLKWHGKKKFAIEHKYNGENGYKTEVLNLWYKEYCKTK